MINQLYNFAQNWTDEGAVWLYSDPHFGDEELAHGFPDKPTDEEQVKRINSKVGKHDTLVILGDVGDKTYVSKLHGYKVLLTGNHDSGKNTYERKTDFKILCDADNNTKQDAIKVAKEICSIYSYNSYDVDEEWDMHRAPFHYWSCVFDNGLFDEVYTGPVTISEKIILSHEPLDIDCMFNIHGHTHNLEFNRNGHWCVCSNIIDYTPVNLKDIINSGRLNEITTLHRTTIDKATERKNKLNV